MKAGFLEKLIAKMNRVEPGEVQGYLVRLVQEKGFLERVFEALQEGVIIIDAQGAVTYVNDAACALFGLDAEDLTGEVAELRIPGLEWEQISRQNQSVSRDLEVTYPEHRFLNCYIAPIVDDEWEEEPMGRVVIIRDITQDRRIEAEKIESETLNVLTMLAAGVAHEIGNPLNSLNIHLQLAERKLKKAPQPLRGELKEIIDISRKEIQRLDFIITNFLSAVRPTRPQLENRLLNDLILESLRFLEPEIDDREIDVTLELEEGLPAVPVDAAQMKQAFYNLIRNASQALGTGGELLIRTGLNDEADTIVVQFRDNGAGISSGHMANIFQPFFTTKESGSGLGLLIVRRIVREHGGELALESEAGKGTTVTCYFPLAERKLRLLETSGA